MGDEKADGKLPLYVRNRIDRLLMEMGVGGRGMTYQDLADRMGMDKGQFSKLMNGRQRVRFDTLQRIALALEVPLGELFQDMSPEVSSLPELVALATRQHQGLMAAIVSLAQHQQVPTVSTPARLLAREEKKGRASSAARLHSQQQALGR